MKNNYGFQWRSYAGLMIALSVILLLSFIYSLMVGSVVISPQRLFGGVFLGQDEIIRLVFWQIRLPRAILGLAVGFSLGLTGAVMQGFMRNPLAEPGVLGVSTGAAMGAVLCFYFGLANLFSLALPLGGILGGFAVILLVVSLAGRDATVQTLILAGIALSALAGAVISLSLNFSPNPHSALDIVFWLMGSLNDRSMEHVMLALPLMVPGWLMLLLCSRPLRALSLGEDTARSMGFSMRRTRWLIILGSAFTVGPAVAVAGSISFVGLIVPHLLRPFVKGDPGRLLAVSGLAGAILLTWSDLLVRLIPTNIELRLGVVTSLIGAPFFFFLLMKLRKEAP